MFLVNAKSFDITITSAKITVASGTSAKVWTKKDSYVGFENSESSWTMVGGEMRNGFFLNMPLYGYEIRLS
jgi:hypothetical protein